MPVAIPIIAAYVAGSALAAGTVAAGVATFAAYATVAGGVLSAAGAVSGNKSLTKLGGILALAGGVGGLAAGAASAASAASSGIDAASTAGDYVNAMDAASDTTAGAASAGGAAVAGAAPAVDLGGTSIADISKGLEQQAAPGAPTDFGASATAGAAAPTTSMPDAGGTYGSLLDAAKAPLQPLQPLQAGPGPVAVSTPITAAPFDQAAMAGGNADKAYLLGDNGYGPAASPAELAHGDAVTRAGQGLSFKDIQALYDKAGSAVGKIGAWANNNQVLAKAGIDALGSMYGPQAEKLDLEKSLLERARANLNSPVRLQFNRGA